MGDDEDQRASFELRLEKKLQEACGYWEEKNGSFSGSECVGITIDELAEILRRI